MPLPQSSQQLESVFLSTERKKSIIIPIYKKRKKKDLEDYMLISFPISPGKIMDYSIQTYKGQEGHLEQSAWIYEGESSLNNFIAFYDDMSSLVHEESRE